MTLTTLIRIFAWLVAAFVTFATMCPIDLRPGDLFPVDVDRALAFVVLAALFTISYPRHIWTLSLILVIGAGVAETFQFLSPTRHAHLDDALVKAFGALIGVFLGRITRMALTIRYPSRSI